MAQTPESKVKEFVKSVLFAYLPNGYWYMPPGGMYGRAGTPDIFYLWRGVFIAIECKSDVGKPSALQLKYLRQIKEQGGVVAIVSGFDKERVTNIINVVKERVKIIEQSTNVNGGL